MGLIRRFWRSISPADDTFEEEARFHLQERTDEYVRRGLSPDDARRVAERRFGSILEARERTADADMFRWLDDLRRDAGYGFRMLSRNPGFSLAAILCLTLGIGATAAVFGWIEGILLRPYPLVVDQDRLYAVTGIERGTAARTDMSWPDWLDLQRSSTLVEAFIAEKITGTTLSVGDHAARVPGSIVSANYFDALGLHPALGRGFVPGEDTGRNAHPVTIISYQTWQERYHADPAIIGKSQLLNGLPHTIVGVAPQGFYGTFVGYAFQFWVPASMQPRFSGGVYRLEDRDARWIEGFVRLKPGVTMEQAQAELSTIASRLERAYPESDRGHGILLFPLWRTPFNNSGAMVSTLGVALAVVLGILIIACANVANLLLVRAFARQQEMTIRLSIGAGRTRLIRQMMTEGLLLSAIATAAGLVVAQWLRNALAFLTPPRGGIPLRLAGALDWRVFIAAGGVAGAATIFFALVPALVSSRIDLAGALRAHTATLAGSRRAAWLRSSLVATQIGLSLMLLIGAGLLVKSFVAIRTANPGFQTDGVLTTFVDAFSAGYDLRRAGVFQDELIDRVRAIPAVESAAFSTTTPFSYATAPSASVSVDGFVPPPDQQPTADYNAVGPEYFSTLAIPIVSGRAFTTADDESSAPVAIVDELMAGAFWHGGNPVGSRLTMNGQPRLVVGVARTIKSRDFVEAPRPVFYVPLRQRPATTVNLHIRTSVPASVIGPALVREIHALDPNISPGELITLREQVERTTASQRIALTMLVVFGVLALVLAAVGLYAVMSATVAQSTPQLALRMALGAEPWNIRRLVLLRGLAMTATGVAIGVVCAIQTTRLMGYLLYQVNPRDPATVLGATVLVVIVALGACVAPAWRATRTDPIQALRG
ncbi:MAG TPA: ABC transporter permease [Vicinamibacterales bacterium]|jgi:macrolide transport system ATP-binding/permease protein|nr:ABC transporter permease [Vicinamibacterales bacterium]